MIVYHKSDEDEVSSLSINRFTNFYVTQNEESTEIEFVNRFFIDNDSNIDIDTLYFSLYTYFSWSVLDEEGNVLKVITDRQNGLISLNIPLKKYKKFKLIIHIDDTHINKENRFSCLYGYNSKDLSIKYLLRYFRYLIEVNVLPKFYNEYVYTDVSIEKDGIIVKGDIPLIQQNTSIKVGDSIFVAGGKEVIGDFAVKIVPDSVYSEYYRKQVYGRYSDIDSISLYADVKIKRSILNEDFYGVLSKLVIPSITICISDLDVSPPTDKLDYITTVSGSDNQVFSNLSYEICFVFRALSEGSLIYLVNCFLSSLEDGSFYSFNRIYYRFCYSDGLDYYPPMGEGEPYTAILTLSKFSFFGYVNKDIDEFLIDKDKLIGNLLVSKGVSDEI